MAVFSYFTSVISQFIKERCLTQKHNNELLIIDAVVHDEKHAVFSARYSHSVYATLIIKNDKVDYLCTCQHSDENNLCEHLVTLAFSIVKFKPSMFEKLYNQLHAEAESNLMFITYYDILYDIENNITLEALKQFAESLKNTLNDKNLKTLIDNELSKFTNEMLNKNFDLNVSVPVKTVSVQAIA